MLLGFLEGGRLVDLLHVGGHCFAVLVADVGPGVAHLMHDTQLHLGLGKGRLDRLGEAGQPVDAGNDDVADAAGCAAR